ncbi:type 1 glutamine amidotransferase [Halorientalis regularis]|uniref:GMP synthase (Glutamine-hydrolysing) n=1 Tax=Halorientalis regularis TaxID=660518 RepID=A0A1G7SPS5_9EURY|nr:type 1 glutamine amidotransferase [Halorientalis regularis]SDG24958.1 GMP synthase (glutamine-hydrolysing) [Halorientalis regularis]
MGTNIAILDASLGDTPAERNLTREIDAPTAVYKVSDGIRPPLPMTRDCSYDGVVISGSQTAVYDDYAWVHELTLWLRALHRADVPVLGICWGHQFIAQALGGRVVDMGEYELGYRTVERRGGGELLADLPDSFTPFQTHSDRVAELPSGAVELAKNDYGIQAFRLASSYGVQFHPEYDRETAKWVIGNKALSADREASVRETITDERVAAAQVVTQVFDNFVATVADHQRQPTR